MNWAGLIPAFMRRRKAPVRQMRLYQASRASRLTAGWGVGETSADAELATSLRSLRARSRALVRDAAYAKRAKQIVLNNVIGPGIGLQAQVMTTRDVLNERINAAIEREWLEWCRPENCHTGAALHFADYEAMLLGQWFETGEAFTRRHYRTFGNSRVPLALELIEAECLPDEMPQGVIGAGRMVRMSIEVDEFYRPLAYWLKRVHPGEWRSPGLNVQQAWLRVPADQMWHLKITSRWPQTRGEPPMHTVMRKLNDMDGYTEAEITAARGAANYMGAIETEEPESSLTGQEASDGSQVLNWEPGTFQHLGPGEKISWSTPNRPNTGVDPFMRLMLREVAAGVGVSYESLARDYSQTTYSSGRLALLDDRDLWKVMQQWFTRSIRGPLHREWLRQAVFARAIPEISTEEYMLNPSKFEAVRFKPRGWSWIDPSAEVEAYAKAIRNGLTTTTDVIAATGEGDDIEDKLERRARELELMRQKGLVFDTDPSRDDKGKVQAPPGAAAPPPDDERVVPLRVQK
jgi:lambda family phage portal protein